jgi:epoxide hydrolase-like predicted phosphatase
VAIKAVVFDIGGVLEITPSTGWSIKWERQLGLNEGQLANTLGEVWQAGNIGAISLTQVHLQISERLGIDHSNVEAMMEDSWQEYLGSLNQDLYSYFRNLRPKFQTAILSNSFVGAREKEQAKYGFEDSCDFIVYSHEVGMSKPDPRIYALTCERLNCEPHEVIFLDDVLENIEAANSFEMRGILFQTTKQAIADIDALINADETA